MPTTLPADFTFAPKVWSDHIMGYFDKQLSFGAMAFVDRTLASAPGTTVNFPYFKTIGAAEKPGANEALEVDKLADNAFTATVQEGGKAVGIRKSALMHSGIARERIFKETTMQIGRVLAEQVDTDLITEVNTDGNHYQAFTSADATEVTSARRLLAAKINAFGDKQSQAVAMYIHSQHYLDLLSDPTSGFLKADANDPFFMREGFMGRVLGMGIFVNDQVPAATAINGKKAYHAFIVKPNAYGIMLKEEVMMDTDYDILNREWVFAGTQWYGVKAFHGKVDAADRRIARLTLVTQLAA